MRAKSVKAENQYRLIMECRSSGLTDHQWCLEHDIKPGTFYSWVKRLRRSGCPDIPAASQSQTGGHKQEIVKIELSKPGIADSSVSDISDSEQFRSMPEHLPAMEIASAGWSIRIPNNTDPVLLRLVLQVLGAVPC